MLFCPHYAAVLRMKYTRDIQQLEITNIWETINDIFLLQACHFSGIVMEITGISHSLSSLYRHWLQYCRQLRKHFLFVFWHVLRL